jgi:hypothetical protein
MIIRYIPLSGVVENRSCVYGVCTSRKNASGIQVYMVQKRGCNFRHDYIIYLYATELRFCD